MADSPGGGFAEGFNSQFSATKVMEMMQYKRLMMMQKFQQALDGFKSFNELIANKNLPLDYRNSIVNSPVYRQSLKLITGMDLPPGQKINLDQAHIKAATQMNEIINNKQLGWGDKQKAFAATYSEAVAQGVDPKEFDEASKLIASRAGAPTTKSVDVGGKTVEAQWNTDTHAWEPVQVAGQGAAVSPSQKAIDTQKNYAEQHSKETDQILAAAGFLKDIGNKQSGVLGLSNRFFHPAAIEQAVAAAKQTLQQLGAKRGLTQEEIDKGMKGGDISKAVERIGKSQQAGDVPPAPASSGAGVVLPGLTVTPTAASPTAPPAEVAPVPQVAPVVPPTQSAVPQPPSLADMPSGMMPRPEVMNV